MGNNIPTLGVVYIETILVVAIVFTNLSHPFWINNNITIDLKNNAIEKTL